MLPLCVPEEPKVLWKLFIDGTKSIRDVLPRPTIQILGTSGYVYVSIKEIVQYHLANRKRLEALVDLPYSAAVRTLHGSSPRGKKLAASCSEDSKDAIPVEVVLWSDDFDPNNTPKNKGSAHCFFASIGTPQDDYHSGCNTYLLSLGPSSGDERTVKSKIAEELIALSHPTSFYWPVDGLKGKEVKISLRLFCTLQDRPERSSWVCFTYGNGRYGGRFGWAADLSQAIAFKNLPSCAECHNLRMTNGQQRRQPQCNCADWNMMFIIFKIPKNYPSFFRSDENPLAPADERQSIGGSKKEYIVSRRLTFSSLKRACDSTFQCIRSKIWSKNNGAAYLETFSLSPAYIKEVTEAASEAISNQTIEQPPIPLTWNIPSDDIGNHIDVPMHLCFLGIQKSVTRDLLASWLKGKKKGTAFNTLSSPFLSRVANLKLYWCHAEVSHGSFVSENWLAYARISKRMPEYPSGSTSCIKKDSPRNLVAPIVEDLLSEANLPQVKDVLIGWHACISRIMSITENPTDTVIDDLERHVKIFLSCIQFFDASRQQKSGENGKDRIPKWRTTFNYLGLLNYPDLAREHGPVRPLSELDFKGEASIQLLKKRFSSGTR
ncbi:unnamed protein product [Cylindrotheca closterium]|uniref:Uncharacterized protein n=1 Tax=Cylindrotheca closterium TaxID=2856 RepID=A0AAD2CGF8_9STRA|nr:unnamed protein product [Cylindrotheca closterium]